MKFTDFESMEKLRQALRTALDELPDGEAMATTTMVKWVSRKYKLHNAMEMMLYAAVKANPLRNFPDHTTKGPPQPGTGYARNRIARPTLWHRPIPPCEHCAGTGRQPRTPANRQRGNSND